MVAKINSALGSPSKMKYFEGAVLKTPGLKGAGRGGARIQTTQRCRCQTSRSQTDNHPCHSLKNTLNLALLKSASTNLFMLITLTVILALAIGVLVLLITRRSVSDWQVHLSETTSEWKRRNEEGEEVKPVEPRKSSLKRFCVKKAARVGLSSCR